MLHGSCLCKTVTYQVEEIVGPYVYCHCISCRKANGSAFAANVSVPIGAFHISSGSDSLSVYESSPGKQRHFCSRCGSPIFTTVGKHPELARVRLGTLDSDFSDSPAAHIFVGEKAQWHTMNDGVREYESWPDSEQLKIPGSRQGIESRGP